MHTEYSIRGRPVLGLIALLSGFGVLLELWLSIGMALGTGRSVVGVLVNFLGYFTVLTNIFVAFSSALMLTSGDTRLGRWLGSGMVLGCTTTAALLVGVAYHYLLRAILAPVGWQWIADVTLHYAVPTVVLGYWIAYPPKEKLPPWAPLVWGIYPVSYFVYVLVRGRLLASYPYHFFDVTRLGYAKTLLDAAGLLVAFLVLGGAVYGVARFRRALDDVRTQACR